MEAIFSELLKIMPVGQVLGLVLLVIILRMIRDVRDQFREMNGSLREVRVWAREHEKLDDERHRSLVSRLK